MAKNTSGEEWASELVRRVGAAVKEARGGKSAVWLSEQTAKLGFRVSPQVISKLDSGHRGSVLSVPELLILAAALDVPPLALLYPKLPDGEVEALPGVTRRSWDAYLWSSGMTSSLDADGGDPGVTAEFHLVAAVRRRAELLQRLLNVQLDADSDDPILRKARTYEATIIRDEIKHLESVIRSVDGVVDDDA